MYRNILVAIDSTAGSIRALNHALELAVALNAQLTVISVVAPLPITVYSSPVGIPSALLESEDVEQTAKLLRKAVAYSKPRLPVHTRLRKGHPAEEIAAQAREGYHDLVIVGSRGRGRLASSILGSVAGGVHFRLHVPLLVVQTSDHETDRPEPKLGADEVHLSANVGHLRRRKLSRSEKRTTTCARDCPPMGRQ